MGVVFENKPTLDVMQRVAEWMARVQSRQHGVECVGRAECKGGQEKKHG